MLEKIQIYYRFFTMFVTAYLKRKEQKRRYEQNEMYDLMDLQSEILSPKHFNIVEFQGVRFDKELLQKVLLQKRIKEDAILENIFKTN